MPDPFIIACLYSFPSILSLTAALKRNANSLGCRIPRFLSFSLLSNYIVGSSFHTFNKDIFYFPKKNCSVFVKTNKNKNVLREIQLICKKKEEFMIKLSKSLSYWVFSLSFEFFHLEFLKNCWIFTPVPVVKFMSQRVLLNLMPSYSAI